MTWLTRGGAQERKSEEIRREHMRIAKDCVLPVQGEREEAHGATSWTMSFAMLCHALPCFAMLCHALPPCTTQRTVTSVTMSHVSKFQNSFQLHLLPISAQDIDPRLWSILDPNQALTWKSYVKLELKDIYCIYIYIKMRIKWEGVGFSTSSLLEETSW